MASRRPAPALVRKVSRCAALLATIAALAASGAGPAEDLIRITPARAAATLVVEGLRDRSKELAASPLFLSLRDSSAVRRWAASPRLREVRAWGGQVEAALGVPITTVLDRVLGEAALLAFFPGPDDAPGESRGLLLVRRHDRELIESMFGSVNRARLQKGEMIRIERRNRGRVAYAARVYRPGLGPDEFYAHLDHATFAWSNSERLLQDVIDLEAGAAAAGARLADDSSFGRAHRGLAGPSLFRLYLASSLIERIRREAPAAPGPVGRIAGGVFGRYASAIGSVGIALNLDVGLTIHVHEALEPARLPAPLRRWLAGASASPAPRPLASSTALAIVGADLDFGALWEVAASEASPADRARLDNARAAARGMLLGVDPVGELLPRIEPHGLAVVEADPTGGGGPLFPTVATLAWSEGEGRPALTPAIGSAVASTLALRALATADRPGMAEFRATPIAVDGAVLTVLGDGTRTAVASRIEGTRLIVGNAVGPVVRFGAGIAPSAFWEPPASEYATAGTFGMVDLASLVRVVGEHRGRVLGSLGGLARRPPGEVERDLDEALELLGLFRMVAFDSRTGAGGTEVHRRLHLRAR